MNAWRAVTFLVGLGVCVDRKRLFRAVTLMLVGYVSMPFAALAIGGFTNDILRRDTGPALWLALLIAVLLVAQLMMSHFAHLDYFELAEMQETGLRAELAQLVNGPPGIKHLDSPEFADGISLIKEELIGTTRALEAVLQLAGLSLQTAITAGILISLSPWLAFLPLAAVAPVLCANRAQALAEHARERTAEQIRLSTHLIELATDSASVKELRIFGTQNELLKRQEAAWDLITTVSWRAQTAAATLRAAGQAIFTLAYGGTIWLLAWRAMQGHASIGDLILVLTLAIQVSTQIAGALQLLTLLQTAGTTAARIRRLRDLAIPSAPPATTPPPIPLNEGLRLDRVTFAYPGAQRPALRDVSLHIPAGATLALVGENGAGKSTLVKLLCGMYRPTGGHILVDGEDLNSIDPTAWHASVTALFQDFYRFQFTLGENIGLGEPHLIDDTGAIGAAVRRARAQVVVDAMPAGLAGYAGRHYGDGVELSGGQWQLTALARSLMRERPLLLVLDEPAAALDAAAEHALFERYATSASDAATDNGGITILVSHRFSTVLMADLIAVLDQGRLTEFGTHTELMDSGGLYAELFRMQARAYQYPGFSSQRREG